MRYGSPYLASSKDAPNQGVMIMLKFDSRQEGAQWPLMKRRWGAGLLPQVRVPPDPSERLDTSATPSKPCRCESSSVSSA